jgi:hypothetical protein
LDNLFRGIFGYSGYRLSACMIQKEAGRRL